MTDFQQGKIFRIDNIKTGDSYISCTTIELPVVLANYRYKTKINKNDLTITLLENYPCENNTELRKRTQHFINIHAPTLNTIKVYRTPAEKAKYRRPSRFEMNFSRLQQLAALTPAEKLDPTIKQALDTLSPQ